MPAGFKKTFQRRGETLKEAALRESGERLVAVRMAVICIPLKQWVTTGDFRWVDRKGGQPRRINERDPG